MNDQVSFGYSEVSPEEKTQRVGAVFSSVAKKYDVMNDAMSGGMHRLWKNQFVRRVKPRSGEVILDMAGGTGDIAFRLAAQGPKVTVSDINQDMLDVGMERAPKKLGDAAAAQLVWSCQNAEALTFADRAFDAYTIAFGIRNVTHIDKALTEAYRVLKPGGRFLCLEFSDCQVPILDRLYDFHSFEVIPRLGQLTTGDREAYQYLVESIRKFPKQDAFAEMIRQAGFTRVSYRNLTGGIAAMHSGWKI